MALEMMLDTLEGVHESLHGEYAKKEDGKFHLIVNGMEDVTGLKNNNKQLIEEKRKLQDKIKAFGDIDPSKAQEALEKLRQLEEKQLLEAGEVDKVVEKRTALMRQDHENQVNKMTEGLEAVTGERDMLKQRLSKAVIERGILDAVNTVGQPRKEALIDIISRGTAVFQLDENGEPKPLNPDGTTIYGKDGKNAMTMVEWATNLLENASHLWLESKGGGARGNVAGGDGRTYTAEELDRMSPSEKMKIGRQQRK